MMRWMIFVIAALAMVKAWMVENRVIALEKQTRMVAELSLATGESVNKLLAQEIAHLQASQMQVEVYQEAEAEEASAWLQL